MRLFKIVFLVALVGCASNQRDTQTTSSSLTGIGSSTKSAIVLDCVSSGLDGVTKELEWINKNHPGYRKNGQMIVQGDGRVYDRIVIRRGRDQKDVYFDITDWFGRFDAIELPEECSEKPS